MKIRKILAFLLVLVLGLSMLTACGTKERPGLPSFEDDEETKASDEGTMTIMVYICGADLESRSGCATTDLNEMIYAEVGDNVHIVVQTGGASEWKNSVISSDSVQRYELSKYGLTLLQDLGDQRMLDSNLMADFIKTSVQQYPADRYGLILWDHGGGTMAGYGYDEHYPNDSMSIVDIADALAMSGVYMDFVGFDCCLMATVETAYAISPYANYMIASEESEPGSGWYYTNFLSALENDPSMSIVDASKILIDDFVSPEYTYLDGGVTLSTIDLSKIDKIVNELYEYMGAAEQYLVYDYGFNEMSSARAGARSYGDNHFEQIDMVDYLTRVSIDASDLVNAIGESIVYNRTNLEGSYGLAMYYPYYYSNRYSDIMDITYGAGFTDGIYSTFFNDFISVAQGGQVAGSDAEDEDWYNDDIVDDYGDEYSYVDTNELYIYDKGEYYALSLSDEDWDLVTDIELMVFLDDGEELRYLGSDDWYEFDEDGDLRVEFDYTWVALNGVVVPYYVLEKGNYDDGRYYSIGYSPATLNEEDDIAIYILWQTGEEPMVLGYTPVDESPMDSKGFFWFEEGDYLRFYYQYFDYDLEPSNEYYLDGYDIVYHESEGLTVSYEDVEALDAVVTFWLRDIYLNSYFTELLFYTD